MPPTVQPNASSGDDRDKRARSGERRSELLCRVRYGNTLPDIPFDPKFITYPFGASRFVEYNPTSLERNFKFDLLTEHDLGVPIDLINPDVYRVLEPSARLAPEDERLLEEDGASAAATAAGGGAVGASPGASKRSRHHNKNVSWLRKTEYISTEYSRGSMQKSDKVEAKVGFNIKKTFKVEDIYKDRESQLRAIERTFAAARVPITEHYSRKGVTPVSVMEVHPDYDLWKHPFAQVIFDSDPAPKPETTAEEMSQAMIRGMVDESGEQFVAYFLPTPETLAKRKHDTESGLPFADDEEYDYLLAREYNWNVKNKASKGYEEMYFFVLRDGAVYYNELETRVRLTKRRKATASGARTRLVVRHREMTEQELGALEMRRSALTEEEDEEEEPSGSGEQQPKLPESGGGGDDADERSGGEEAASGSDNDDGDDGGSGGRPQKRRRSSSGGGSSQGSGERQAESGDDDDGSDDDGSSPRKKAKEGSGSGSDSEAEGDAARDEAEGGGKSSSSSGGEESDGEKEAGSDAAGSDAAGSADDDDEKKIFGSGSSSSEAESDSD